MKKTLVALVFTLVAVSARAQQEPGNDGAHKPPTPAEMLQRITKDLQLNELQQKQFKSFLDAQDVAPRPTELERSARGQKDRKAIDEKLKSILTELQFKKWQEIKANRKPRKME